MPWSASDATKHSKKADTEAKKRKWAAVANSALEKYGEEGRAIKIANAAVGKQRSKPHHTRKVQ